MEQTLYQIPGERIFIFDDFNIFDLPIRGIIRDKDSFGRDHVFKNEEEKIKIYFLIKLVEKYKYREKDIQLDVEFRIGNYKEKVDIIVYKNNQPFIMVECKSGKNIAAVRRERMLETIIKARILEAKYAVLLFDEIQAVFDVQQKPKRISDIPLNT